MSATWNILTFTVPGKQHILHCVPSAPLRFSKGAKTTTQLGRLHPSLWRTDPVLICRVSLLSFNSCSQNQSPKQKTPAQWHTNLQPWRTKIPAISCGTQIICEVCPPASLRPQYEDHRLFRTFAMPVLWRQYWSGLTEHILAGRGGGGGVQESHQTFWTPTVTTGWFKMSAVDRVYRA